MYFTLNQAAKETGRSKGTISRYLKNGTLSYVSKDEHGYKIDSSELFRVFSNKTPETGAIEQTRTPVERDIESTFSMEKKYLLEKITMLEDSLGKSEQREQDVSAKLDKAQSVIEKQTYLITDMRDKQTQTSSQRRGLFTGFLRKAS